MIVSWVTEVGVEKVLELLTYLGKKESIVFSDRFDVKNERKRLKVTPSLGA